MKLMLIAVLFAAAAPYVSAQSPAVTFVGHDKVAEAIAKGGGLTDIGSDRGVKVTHKDGRVEKLDLDGRIAPGDVIVIGERLF